MSSLGLYTEDEVREGLIAVQELKRYGDLAFNSARNVAATKYVTYGFFNRKQTLFKQIADSHHGWNNLIMARDLGLVTKDQQEAYDYCKSCTCHIADLEQIFGTGRDCFLSNAHINLIDWAKKLLSELKKDGIPLRIV